MRDDEVQWKTIWKISNEAALTGDGRSGRAPELVLFQHSKRAMFTLLGKKAARDRERL